MSARAKFVREVTVIDPDTKGGVEISIYKHENGGMFGIDTSYADQVLDEGDDMSMGGTQRELLSRRIPKVRTTVVLN